MKTLITAIVLVSFWLIFGAQKMKKIKFNPIPVNQNQKEIIKEPDPPYFGASVYELIQQPLGEVYEFLQGIRQAEGNATEIFLVHSLFGNTFQPYHYNGSKFDLDRWNEEYWTYLRYFLYECRALGIAPFIRIHDYCSIKRPECNKYYAFMNNIQGFTNVYDKGLYEYYLTLNKRLLQELDEAGIKKFFLIPMSECDGSSDEVYDFNNWYASDLIQVIISADPKHFKRLESLDCRYESHDIASVPDIKDAVEKFEWFIFPNGDGCHGDGPKSEWTEYAEPSEDQAKSIGEFVRYHHMFGYCYKLRSIFSEKGKVDLIRADFSVLRALTKTQ